MNFWDDDNMDKIVEHVYISNLISARSERLIEQNKIRHIVSISSEGKGISKYHGVNILFLTFDDDLSANPARHFSKVFDFIENAIHKKENVLIHCVGGVSRSPTLVAAWMIRKFGWTPKHALQSIRAKRSCVDPNSEFLKQLENFYSEVSTG